MNKRILLILISLLFLSCGRNESNNKSLVKFSFPRIEGVMSADGGVFIFGRHLQLKDTFSTFLDTSGDKREFEQLLSSGDWNFRAIHFTDGNPLNDLPTYCGQIKAQLSGGTYEFDIKLTKTDCNHPVFAGELGLNGAFSTTNSQLKSLHVYFCSQSAFSAGDNSSCLEDMHLKSFKVVYPRTPVHGVELVTDPGLKQAILSLGSVPPSGTNIGQYTPLQNSLANIIGASAASALMTELAKENIYVPADNVPNLNLYLKAQAKSGLEINLSKDKWFGHFSLYGLYRADYYKLISSDALVNDKDIIDINDNSRIYLASDLSMGYVWKNYRFSMSFDDLAFAELSDNLTATNGNDLYYDPDPLFRFQASGKYKLSIFHIMPYLGLHKRSGYDLSDGWYFGGNLEGRLWKDRLRSNLRLGMDSEHFTIAPGFRLWFLQLDGNLKLPVSNEVDGKKVSTLYSLALRFMIEV